MQKTNKQLMKFVIDDTSIREDLSGKQGAIQELGENKKEMTISGLLLSGMVLAVAIPPILALIIAIIVAILRGMPFENALATILGVTLFTSAASGVFIGSHFFSRIGAEDEPKLPSRFSDEVDRLDELWERRKELNRYVEVDSDAFEQSQARNFAPFLLARIARHNKVVASSIRFLELQRAHDLRSTEKRAPMLEQKILEKLEKGRGILKADITTYEALKLFPDQVSIEELAIDMTMEDPNAASLNEFLAGQASALGIVLDDIDAPKELPG